MTDFFFQLVSGLTSSSTESVRGQTINIGLRQIYLSRHARLIFQTSLGLHVYFTYIQSFDIRVGRMWLVDEQTYSFDGAFSASIVNIDSTCGSWGIFIETEPEA